MKQKKNIKKYIIFAIFLALFLGANIVYAETTAQLKFCDYGGVRKALKILGIILTLVKVAVPILLVITGMGTFVKAITTGKDDDLKGAGVILVRKMIAGLVVFMLPTLLDYVFDSLVGYSDSGFTQCTNCILDTGHCNVNVEDPKTD